jgi:4a-hydroxytetrahydrobiopterin dehydratase
MDSINFVNQIAKIAEDEGHHPNIKIEFTIVSLEIYTHAIKGLSENDFILAAKIDEVYEEEFKL